jgi:mRNA interferase ChpB
LRRGDIYLISLDPTMGHEQQGTRPVLVVSPDKFNALMKVPIVVPITSGGAFVRNAGFAVSLASAGTRTTGIVLCNQPRPLDLDARKGRRLESVPAEIVDEVLARIATLFE